MKIKEKYKQADAETKKFWRMEILNNWWFLKTYLLFVVMGKPRPRMSIGDDILDDGEVKTALTIKDFTNLHCSLNPSVVMLSIKLRDFMDWFLELDEQTYYHETENESFNFLTFEYMQKAWNDFIEEVEE